MNKHASKDHSHVRPSRPNRISSTNNRKPLHPTLRHNHRILSHRQQKKQQQQCSGYIDNAGAGWLHVESNVVVVSANSYNTSTRPRKQFKSIARRRQGKKLSPIPADLASTSIEAMLSILESNTPTTLHKNDIHSQYSSVDDDTLDALIVDLPADNGSWETLLAKKASKPQYSWDGNDKLCAVANAIEVRIAGMSAIKGDDITRSAMEEFLKSL
jgi:hypothetical protein